MDTLCFSPPDKFSPFAKISESKFLFFNTGFKTSIDNIFSSIDLSLTVSTKIFSLKLAGMISGFCGTYATFSLNSSKDNELTDFSLIDIPSTSLIFNSERRSVLLPAPLFASMYTISEG